MRKTGPRPRNWSAAASAFIEQQADEPFFAYLHFLDVHDPHRIPQEYHGRFADPADFAYDMQDTLLLDNFVMKAWWEAAQGWRDRTVGADQVATYFADYVQLYDASISYWDEQLGTLLDLLAAQGIDERTIIVVTSDHGEQFLEHGYFGHGNSGYQVGLHVPFIISDPLHPNIAGLRVDNLVNAVDILPTLLAAAQLANRSGRAGAGALVFARVRRAGRDLREHLYRGDLHGQPPFSTLIQTYREGEWKLLLDRLRDTKELYHLKEDPGELRDRFAEQPEIAARLYDKIRQHYNSNLQLFEQQQQSQMQLTEQKLQELRALGYITGRAGLQRPAQEFFPMKPVRLEKFGPFGTRRIWAGFPLRSISFAAKSPGAKSSAGTATGWASEIRSGSGLIGGRLFSCPTNPLGNG